MKYALLILFVANLFANDVLNNYRLYGIAGLEKQLDLELSKEEYWSGVLKNRDTTFGYIEPYKNVLACNKTTSVLEFYSIEDGKSFKLKKKYNAFTGKNDGDKTKEGDRKTPTGIYQLVQKMSKETSLDPFYGPFAFVTSYPNIYDSYKGRSGSGIWIHGLPADENRDEFTRGCIAINNKNLECLNKNINLDETLLIINNAKVEQNISKKTLAALLAQLYAWRYAWLYDDIEAYMNFYSPEFVRSDGMKYNIFKMYKTRVFSKNEKKSIVFSNITVVPYPNVANTYQITFKEAFKSPTTEFNGSKTLVVEYEGKGNFKIVTEQ